MIKFYFDEDLVQHRLIAALRSHGLDVATSLEAGMNARDDAAHLIHAAGEGRILVSANAGDFIALHSDWMERGLRHSGILIVPQQRYSTGEIVRRMVSAGSSTFDFSNGLFFLSSF